MLSAADQARLCHETGLKWLEQFAELPSTNDAALERARSSDPVELPGMIITDRQTAGRGQGSKPWWSTHGGLTFSVLCTAAQLLDEGAPQNALVVALAWQRTLRPDLAAEQHLVLKWPNDLWLAGKKLGGILIESVAVPQRRVVVGCGINLNQDFASAPPEIQQRATSLAEHVHKLPNLTQLLIDFMRHWGELTDELHREPERLCEAWEQASGMVGQTIRVRCGKRLCEGECVGVDATGRLLIHDGIERHALTSGQLLQCGAHSFQD